jgi:hypothetical protein
LKRVAGCGRPPAHSLTHGKEQLLDQIAAEHFDALGQRRQSIPEPAERRLAGPNETRR